MSSESPVELQISNDRTEDDTKIEHRYLLSPINLCGEQIDQPNNHISHIKAGDSKE